MSQSVARARASVSGLPDALPEWPTLPPWIRRHVEAVLEPDPARRSLLSSSLSNSLRDADRAIAARAAEIVGEWLAPADRDVISRWLLPIAASVEHRSVPASDQAMAAFVAAVAMLGIPARCFNGEAQRAALRSWTWWPSAERIADLLEPPAVRLRQMRDELDRLSRPVSASVPQPAENLSAEVRAAIVERFRARYATEVAEPVARTAKPAAPVRAKQAPLSPGALAAAYRATAAQGGPLAAVAAARAARLEAAARAVETET